MFVENDLTDKIWTGNVINPLAREGLLIKALLL